MKKILYVEDARSQREIMKQMLELYGEYEVIIADHGQEGLEKAREVQPDIILMDLRMPIMDGIKAIQELKKDPNLSDIPIIVISAWANKENREESMKAGAIKFFEKPTNYNKLLATIREITEGD